MLLLVIVLLAAKPIQNQCDKLIEIRIFRSWREQNFIRLRAACEQIDREQIQSTTKEQCPFKQETDFYTNISIIKEKLQRNQKINGQSQRRNSLTHLLQTKKKQGLIKELRDKQFQFNSYALQYFEAKQ